MVLPTRPRAAAQWRSGDSLIIAGFPASKIHSWRARRLSAVFSRAWHSWCR